MTELDPKNHADDSDALLRHVDQVCEAFEAAWQRGEEPRLEDYLGNAAGAERLKLLQELLRLDLDYRGQNGDRPTREEYRRRFPTDGELIGAGFSEAFAAVPTERARVSGVPPTGQQPVAPETHVDSQQTIPPVPDGESLPEAVVVASATNLPAIPGHEVLCELRKGGQGVVYKARHVALKRLVAVKMIRADELAGADDRARFRADAEALAGLQHPNIVQIHEVGEHEGHPYFSLEFMHGGSLDKKLKGTPQPFREAAQLVETLARAMHAVHQRNIVHRDLKPANVLLTTDGTPKITDFGLAKRLDVEVGRTQEGVIMGTPPYMAPEQAAGKVKQITPLADVYALGAILYEVLTGRPPFRAATNLDTLLQVLNDEPVPPRRLQPKVPRDLETICLKCLEKLPEKRYATAEALASDLRCFVDGRGQGQ
jgi:tRNA A-37 threonylcarbamoyl transferase component Bud32